MEESAGESVDARAELRVISRRSSPRLRGGGHDSIDESVRGETNNFLRTLIHLGDLASVSYSQRRRWSHLLLHYLRTAVTNALGPLCSNASARSAVTGRYVRKGKFYDKQQVIEIDTETLI